MLQVGVIEFEGTFDINFEPDTITESSERTLAGIVAVLEAMMTYKISWDASICDTLIDECLKMNDIDGVKFVFYVMNESGIDIKTNTLNMLLKRYAENGDSESAYNLIESMKRHGDKTYPNKKSWNLLLEAGNKSQKGRFYSRNVIKDLRNEGSMDKEYYDRLVEFAVLTKKAPDAIFESMVAAQCLPDQDTIIFMLKAFFRIGDIDSALKWYRRLRRADNLRRSMLIDYMKEQVAGKSYSALSESDNVDLQLPPPSKNIVMLILKALSSEGRYKEALALLRDFNDGCQIASFQSTEESVVLDESAVQDSSSNKVKIVNAEGKKVVIVKALSSQAEKDSKKVVTKTTDETFFCSHYSPDISAYTMVIEACIKAGEPQEGLKVFSEMERVGISPDQRIYSLLIKIFADLGDVSSALGVFDEMRNIFATDVDSLHGVINACMKDPLDLRQAALLLEKMSEDGVDLDIYSGDILMQKFPDASALSQALMVMHSQPILPDVQVANVSLAVVSCLVRAALQEKKFADIFEAIEFLGKVGVRLDAETLEYFTIPDIPRDESPLSKHYYETFLPHKDKVRSLMNIEVPSVYKENENCVDFICNIPEPIFEFGKDSYASFSKLFVKSLEKASDVKVDDAIDIEATVPSSYLPFLVMSAGADAGAGTASPKLKEIKSTKQELTQEKPQHHKFVRVKGGRKSLADVLNSEERASVSGRVQPMRQKGLTSSRNQKQSVRGKANTFK